MDILRQLYKHLENVTDPSKNYYVVGLTEDALVRWYYHEPCPDMVRRVHKGLPPIHKAELVHESELSIYLYRTQQHHLRLHADYFVRQHSPGLFIVMSPLEYEYRLKES